MTIVKPSHVHSDTIGVIYLQRSLRTMTFKVQNVQVPPVKQSSGDFLDREEIVLNGQVVIYA